MSPSPRRLTYIPLDDLEPAEKNPKGHAPDVIASSVGRFGYLEPVVVDDRTGRLIAGHGRRDDLLRRRDAGESPPEGIVVRSGAWCVPVVRGWASADDTEALAAGVALNRTVELGGWDQGELAGLLSDLAQSERGLDGLGFVQADLDDLIRHVEFDARVGLQGDPDEVPDVPKVAVTQRGDLWVLGDHRVLCGDATDPKCHALVLDGAEADMVWTDPPYGIDYRTMQREGKPIVNDETLDQASRVLSAALAITRPSVCFIACAWRSLPSVLAVLFDLNIEAKACIVWDKQRRVQNLDRYAKQHEMLIYVGPFGGEPTRDVDVWQIPRDFDPDVPTPKPVELIARSLRSASLTGDLVLDPFAGSGSTLVACQELARRAALIEISAEYVDVICARFQRLTGIKPTRDGQPHDFCA